MARLLVEKTSTLEQMLPKRYRMRREARVYPIAVELVVADGPPASVNAYENPS